MNSFIAAFSALVALLLCLLPSCQPSPLERSFGGVHDSPAANDYWSARFGKDFIAGLSALQTSRGQLPVVKAAEERVRTNNSSRRRIIKKVGRKGARKHVKIVKRPRTTTTTTTTEAPTTTEVPVFVNSNEEDYSNKLDYNYYDSPQGGNLILQEE